MARPPSYDRQEVLEQVKTIFWTQGYAATSIKDLMAATGLQPGSIYGAFKNKKNLFRIVLEDHFVELEAQIRALMESDQPIRERMETFLMDAIRQDYEQPDNRAGSFLLNTLQETTIDPETMERVREMIATLEKLLENALRKAQMKGELGADKEPAVLASYFMTVMFGLRVQYRRGPRRSQLEAVARTALCALA